MADPRSETSDSNDGSGSGRSLLPHHQELLEASAISTAVADARGYRSVIEKRELNGIFGPVQQRVPGLLVPLFDVYGELRSYQLRPDEPRVGKNGKAIKYETPRGLKMMIDCPPATLRHVRNPKVTLWITEGIRKVDSLASVGLRGIALLGVDCWRGTNEMGGKTTLEDWFGVALNERKIVICFDSDAFEKPEVHKATETLGRWLETRGAEISFAYLPHADDGSKQGVDDYLATHTRDDLLGRIERAWHQLPHETVRGSGSKSDAPLRATAELLYDARAVLDRFVILPSAAARLAIALYALHTWAFDAAHATPYLVIQSATKRSGKTRLEEVLEMIVRAPWRIAAASESAVFRKIDAQRPTLLLDEVDALFGARSEGTEPIRAILNAGNRPGAAVARMVGEGANMQPVDFSVYCPKVLAGINTQRWPDTVTDRAIVIQLQRKKPNESVQRLRHRKLLSETEPLRAGFARWAQEHVEALHDADPELPEGLDDRAAEAWEPLLAIAEIAAREDGEDWVEHARRAALKLAGGRVEDDAHGLVALRAIRGLIGERDAIHTSTIVSSLNGDERLPFSEYRKGAGLNARGLAKLLQPFAVSPHNVSVDGVQAKGFRREQFSDLWARYADSPRADASNPSARPAPSNDGGFGDFSIRPADPDWTDSKSAENPDKQRALDGWTDQNAQTGAQTPSDTQNGGPDAEKRQHEEKLVQAAVDTFDAVDVDTDSDPIVRASSFAHAWAAVVARDKPDEPVPSDPYPFEHRADSGGRLGWREGYGWRRVEAPDGEPLPPLAAGPPPEDWCKPKAKINRVYTDPNAPLIMDFYADRPEKLAETRANAEALERLVRMSTEPSIYAGHVARARDSFEVGLLLWQIEGAMRSLERRGKL